MNNVHHQEVRISVTQSASRNAGNPRQLTDAEMASLVAAGSGGDPVVGTGNAGLARIIGGGGLMTPPPPH